MEESIIMNAFPQYNGQRVLVTGHTGFKGSWLCEWLINIGAEVYGYSLNPPTKPSLFNQLHLAHRIKEHKIGDIRDLDSLTQFMQHVKPAFVFHLAAQPLVIRSYKKPVETFETNVMGTVNILEAARKVYCQRKTNRNCSIVCITTDKCYENIETTRPYRESDPMGGFDPYSCSKGCDELLISSYRRSFFGSPDSRVWVASARAGNVIGGGDWATDRIVPDAMRAIATKSTVIVRNPDSVRPWQHVLEPLSGYLMLGAALASRTRYSEYASGFNFGPNSKDNHSVKELINEILRWSDGNWEAASVKNAAHESKLLRLDIKKANRILGWKPRLDFNTAVKNTAVWYNSVLDGGNPLCITQGQIQEYMQAAR